MTTKFWEVVVVVAGRNIRMIYSLVLGSTKQRIKVGFEVVVITASRNVVVVVDLKMLPFLSHAHRPNSSLVR